MKTSTLAALILLLFVGAFLAVIYLAGGRVTRDELWIVLSFVGIAFLLLDPADAKELALRALDKLPWGRSQ